MRMKRWIAGLLCVCLLGTSDAIAVNAAAIGEPEQNQEELLQKNRENTDEAESVKKPEENSEEPATAEESKDSEAAGETEGKEEASLISYAVIDSPYIETPGEQRVVVGVGTEETKLEGAILEYKNRNTGEIFQTEAEEILENAALFHMNFENEKSSGIYELSAITTVIEGVERRTEFREAGMEMVFGVNQEAESNPDGVVIDEQEDVDIDVVTIDENGNTTSEKNIPEAIEEAQEAKMYSRSVQTYGTGGNVIVVLDPGHDATHGGGGGNEAALNLAIARYCKAELETYAGVSVYMTRDEACPYPGTSSADCNANRVAYAKSIGANVYVSLHNNAGGGNGAEVYYPNSNYNPGIGAQGQALAQNIQNQLVALGLHNRGIKIRNSGDGTRYPDGSLADYYGVIRRSKLAGIPAVIVEHAFMDSSDAANFLSSPEKLQKLGIADATGIAQYFGLQKKQVYQAPTITAVKSAGNTTLKITWKAVPNASGYIIYRSTKKDGNYKKIATLNGGNTTAYTNTGAKAEQTYYYKIKTSYAVDGGNKYSGYSQAHAGKTVKNTTIVSVKSVESSSLQVNWEKVSGANGYYIYRSTSKNGSYKRVGTVSGGGTTSFTENKLLTGKLYYYKIKSRNKVDGSTGYSDYSNVFSGKTVAATSIIQVKARGSKRMEVSWKEVDEANGYYIYRSTKESGGYQKIAIVSGKSTVKYEDTSVSVGKTYYYKVRSRNRVNNFAGRSSASKAAYGTTVAATKITQVKSQGNNNLRIVWKAVSGANGYYIYRSTKSNGSYKRIATIDGKNVTKYADTNVERGITYYYQIKTRNKVNGITGYGDASQAANGKTVISTKITSVRSQSSTKLKMNWTVVEGANGYYIYRSTTKNGGYKRIATLSGKSTAVYTDSSLKAGTKYYYKIKSRNSVNGVEGYSDYSSVAEGSPLAKTSVTSLQYDGNAVVMQWKKGSGATAYRIQRAEGANGTYTKIAEISSGTQVSYRDATAQPGKTYSYRVQIVKVTDGKMNLSDYSSAKSITILNPIMGASTVNVNQMVKYYNRTGKPYPSGVYASKGAADITAFCNIVMQEAAAEGVRADVLFAQICNETGFLQFGGDVQPGQCNFGGLGATGGGVPGESFPDVRTGIRAQVQHLKAYACTEPLNQSCVDSRFAYVTRGCAPFVEWLGIQENPSGKGWAAAKNYGYNLMNMVRTMQTM